MTRIKLKLVGCERYNFGGELYEKGKVYNVGESKGKILMRKEDNYGRPFFATYVKPLKSEKQQIAEKAARLAIAAAAAAVEEEENEIVIEDEVEVVEEVDPEAAVEEVDTDDDPELDEEDPENPDEVDVEP